MVCIIAQTMHFGNCVPRGVTRAFFIDTFALYGVHELVHRPRPSCFLQPVDSAASVHVLVETERLPSVDVAREYLHSVLIPKAKRQEIFLIVIRKHALWRVEGILDSATLRIPKNLCVGGALGPLGAQVRSWLDARRSGG